MSRTKTPGGFGWARMMVMVLVISGIMRGGGWMSGITSGAGGGKIVRRCRHRHPRVDPKQLVVCIAGWKMQAGC